ncbi:hypothetical protein SteCoe_19174 [Stentor coeruleus]|uniref:Cyclic nucleotide-binding domain-containing protein n=1 Tax=Stentor coeruleus TaxID=5963 RepID=A0A1R2BUU7_9CILI|nr:hypothetical protein SteCoe_19174 [Stentor coeruleus]
MFRSEKIMKAKSPQSARAIEEDDYLDNSLLEPDQLVFSVLKPSNNPTKQRISYLWKRTRILIKALSRLIKVWKDIQLYGCSKNHLETDFARRESDEISTHFKGDKYLFQPEGNFIKAWSFVIILLLIYTASVVPYKLCFVDETSYGWYIYDTLVDCLFVCDIFVTFNTTCQDEEMKVIVERKSIAINYVKTWFFIDFIACIPFQLLISNSQSYNKLIRIARIPRLYKVLRFLKLLKFTRTLSSIEFFNKLFELLNVTDGIIRMGKFFIMFLLVIHINGCIWYFIARIDDLNNETWLIRYNTDFLSNGDLYLMSIYFVMQTIATIGFGDIVPFTIIERVYALLLMIIGVGFYSYIVGNLSNIVKTLDNDFVRIKIMLTALNEFAKATKLPLQLKDKIKRHIETESVSNIMSFPRDSLIKELPGALKKELRIQMHNKIVEKILFFQDKDEQFIARFVGKMKKMEVITGEYVYMFGDYSEEIYFICRGRVVMKADNGMVFKNYMQGSYFGELETLNNITRKCSAQAISSKTALMIITKRDFLCIMKDYPEVLSEVKATAKLREQKILEIHNNLLSIKASCALSKSKTSKDNENFGPKPMTSRQGWKNFLKQSLGITPTKDPPCKIESSVWDEYAKYKDNNDSNKKFIHNNSLTELLKRVNTKKIIPRPKIFSILPRGTFSKPFLQTRKDKKIISNNELEIDDYSPMISMNESNESFNLKKDEGKKNVKLEDCLGDLINDLHESEKLAEKRFCEVSKELEEISNRQLEVKARLEEFFVNNINFSYRCP